MWGEAPRLRAALEAFHATTLSENALCLAANAILDSIEGKRPETPGDLGCDDPVVRALCGVAGTNDRTPDRMREAEVALTLLGDTTVPLAHVVRLRVAKRFFGALDRRASALLAGMRDTTRDWPPVTLSVCVLGHSIDRRDGVDDRTWLREAVEVIETHGLTGTRVGEVFWSLSHDRIDRQDYPGALAAIDEGRRHWPEYDWDLLTAELLLHQSRPDEALSALQAARPGIVSDLQSIHAFVQRDDLRTARQRLEALEGHSSRIRQDYRTALLAAAGGRPSSAQVIAAAGSFPGSPAALNLFERAVRGLPSGSTLEPGYRRAWALMLGKAKRPLGTAARTGASVSLGAYTLLQPIGSGANATVWEAVHEATGRAAAVKILHSANISNASLQDEGRLLARMRHPNILSVNAVGRVDAAAQVLSFDELSEGSAWVATELVNGGTLESFVGTLAWPEAQAVLAALLDGLAHAHGAGVLHLDIKPANVLLSVGEHGWRPRLADFGVFALLAQATRRRVAGTPAYMPPEQWRGGPHTPQTDLYALGVLAWELLVGRRPFAALDFDGLRQLHETAPRPELSEASPELQVWVHRLMAPAPADRFPSASAARRALLALDTPTLPRVEISPEHAATRALTRVSAPLDRALVLHTSTGTADPHVGERPDRLPPVPPEITPTLALEAFDAGALIGLESLQDALWRDLRLAASSRRRVVVLEGPSEAVARWLVRAARSVGLAAEIVDTDEPDALAPLRERLGTGPSVVWMRASGEVVEAWVQSLESLPCLVVANRWPDPQQRFRVPRLSIAALSANLRDRFPLDPDTSVAIARTGVGALQPALDVLASLARSDSLEPSVIGWRLAPGDALAPHQDDSLRRAVRTRIEEDPVESRHLAIHALARRPVEGHRDFTDEQGVLLPPVSEVLIEAWGQDESALDEAARLAERPAAQASIAWRKGDTEGALAIAESALLAHQTDAEPTHSSEILRTVRQWDIRLPSFYHYYMGVFLHRFSSRSEAVPHLRVAAGDPRFQHRAQLLMANTKSDHRIETLRDVLRAAAPQERDSSRTLLAVALWETGQPSEARALLAATDTPFARGWAAFFTLPSQPDPAWEREVRAGSPPFPWMALLAAAYCVWGEPDKAAVIEVEARSEWAADLLIQVARGKYDGAREALQAHERPVDRLPYAAPIRWLLEIHSSDARWELATERWPCERYSPIAEWILERAMQEARPDRAIQIGTVLRSWEGLGAD